MDQMDSIMLKYIPNDTPTSVKYRGETYYFTGKTGTQIATGLESAEYESCHESGNKTGIRVWRNEKGEIYLD